MSRHLQREKKNAGVAKAGGAGNKPSPGGGMVASRSGGKNISWRAGAARLAQWRRQQQMAGAGSLAEIGSGGIEMKKIFSWHKIIRLCGVSVKWLKKCLRELVLYSESG
jgi:hypothetical protein